MGRVGDPLAGLRPVGALPHPPTHTSPLPSGDGRRRGEGAGRPGAVRGEEAEARQEFESTREEIKNKSSEDYNVLRFTLEGLIEELERLPEQITGFLEGVHPIDEIAIRHHQKPFFLYLGRNVGLPVCLEGALKLKEISYIPTEAYSAGEMKHGPIALLDADTPVVCIATDSHVYEKMVSNIQEVRARNAQVIAIATDGN